MLASKRFYQLLTRSLGHSAVRPLTDPQREEPLNNEMSDNTHDIDQHDTDAHNAYDDTHYTQ
ncbi:MAG TPA: hypothetical protein VLL52_22935 [Anaerolineae bacterium]|nr:hypothetical protein [Anaerolineae bacterium]